MQNPLVIRAVIAFGIVLIVGGLMVQLVVPPKTFPSRVIVEIKQGESLIEISNTLKTEHVVRSAFMLRSAVLLFGGELRVMRGFYLFDAPQNIFTVASRIIHGEYGLESAHSTIPEGSNRFVIADIFASKIPGFSKEEFLQKTVDKEGYLFPDTYNFLPHTTAQTVIDTLSSNYEKKIAPLREKFVAFGKSEKDIITMASILEGEARQTDTRRTIAGILWRRLSIGMPLQVDTAFIYVNGKTTEDLTLADLAIKSPYNTYVNRGFPPTPISNPGLDSILAAITPIKTPYLYFLTDADGVMHYAKTLQEHAANKQKYLK